MPPNTTSLFASVRWGLFPRTSCNSDRNATPSTKRINDTMKGEKDVEVVLISMPPKLKISAWSSR